MKFLPLNSYPLAEQTEIFQTDPVGAPGRLAKLVELKSRQLGHIGISLNLSAIDLETPDFIRSTDDKLLQRS